MPSPKSKPIIHPCAKCGLGTHPNNAWAGGIPLCGSCRAVCVDKMAHLMDSRVMPREGAQAIVARELIASQIIRERGDGRGVVPVDVSYSADDQSVPQPHEENR